MEHTLALIEKAHEGDKAARDTLAEENMGLVWSMVRRFANRGVEMEDLCQIGSIGLLKAIDKFDPSFEVCFSTYAVPMIAGEIRRFLRSEGMVKVSRPIRELAWKAYAVRERLERENGRDPTLAEIAGELDVTVEEIVEAMESGAEVETTQRPIVVRKNATVSTSKLLRFASRKSAKSPHSTAINARKPGRIASASSGRWTHSCAQASIWKSVRSSSVSHGRTTARRVLASA